MKDTVLKENVMNNNKNEKENVTMENKNNTNAGYVDIRSGLSTKKMLNYRCEGEGVYYEFPHYLIHSENHRIQCDSDTFIDITAMTSYNEKVTVLIKRSDLNTAGFKLFINDRLTASLNCINKMKIKNSENIERYACYRELRTLVDFINKYKINWMVKDGEITLVHTIDERYKHFAVVEFYDDGSECEYEYAENHLTEDDCNAERIKAFINKSNNVRKCYSLQYIEEVIYMIENDDELDKEIIIKMWKIVLKNLIRAFNRKRKEGWSIENIWKSRYGEALNMFIEFICNSNKFVKELTGKYAHFSIKVNEDCTLNLTIDYAHQEELDYVITNSSQEIYKPGDEITVSHQG